AHAETLEHAVVREGAPDHGAIDPTPGPGTARAARLRTRRRARVAEAVQVRPIARLLPRSPRDLARERPRGERDALRFFQPRHAFGGSGPRPGPRVRRRGAREGK